MTKNIEEFFKKLEALYKELPVVHCQGKCQGSCTSIGLTWLEMLYIKAKFGDGGVQFHNRQKLVQSQLDKTVIYCPQLDEDGKCRIYERRPSICRLYGAVPMMACEYSCEVTPRVWTNAEGLRWLARIEQLSDNYFGKAGTKIL